MSRRARIFVFSLGTVSLILALAAAVLLWCAKSETALQWAAAKVVTSSGGRVSITGARGSLAGRLTLDRIVYKTSNVEVLFTDVVVDWRPHALLSRRISIATLSSGSVEITLLPSPTATELPDALDLPIAVGVDRLRIAKLVVRSDATPYAFSGIEAGYAGNAVQHAITSLVLQSDFGSVNGNLVLAATKPFAIGGSLDWGYGQDTRQAFVHATLGGVLDRITAELKGGVRAVPLHGSAVLALFADNWLPEMALAIRNADLAVIDAVLPHTAISGTLKGGSDIKGRLSAVLTLDNTSTGTWTDKRLPVSSLAMRVAAAKGGLQLDDLRASLGAGGKISGTGHVTSSGSDWNLALTDLNLRAIHKPLRTTKLVGRVKVALTGGRQAFDASLTERGLTFAASGAKQGDRIDVHNLKAKAGKGEFTGKGELSLVGMKLFRANTTFTHFDPSDFGDFPRASISGEANATGQLAPDWQAEARFTIKDSKFRGAPLVGSGKFKASARDVSDTTVDLSFGQNRLQARGSFGAAGDALNFEFDGQRLVQLDSRFAGKLAVRGTLGGTIERPTLLFDIKGEALAFEKRLEVAAIEARGEWRNDADPRVQLKAVGRKVTAGIVQLGSFSADMNGTRARHTISIDATAPGADFAAQFEGGLRAERDWAGRVMSLQNRGRIPFALRAPVSLEVRPSRAVLGETTADVLGGRFSLRSLRWENNRLTSEGGFTGLPAAALLALGGAGPAPGSNLALRGSWAVNATPRLNGTLTIAREAGDLVVRQDPVLPLGLERLELDMKFTEDAARAVLAIRGKQIGDVAAEIATAPPAGAGPFAQQSKLTGAARIDLATLRSLNDWLGNVALVDGAARVRLALAGTLALPLLTGTVEGDRISIEAPQHGVALKDGRLRAELTERALMLTGFSIAGPSGTLAATGTLVRRETDGESHIKWQADALRLFDRPDQRLTVTGGGTVDLLSSDRLRMRGQLKVLDGHIEFERPTATRLGDDVVVVGRKAKPAPGVRRKPPLDLDATLDFGERFKIVGAGLESGLQGNLRMHTSRDGTLLATGRVRAVNGTYFAFGQKLTIERGQLYFDGPINNPGLEIVAVRKNLPVEAGVEVTGTVRVSRVRLISEPPVPDGEKLAWLVTGRGLDSASGADIALLQAAASTLINSKESIPLTRRIARQIGLDDIGTRSAGSSSGTLDSQMLVVGKRLSDDLYLEYEHGLDIASTVLRLTYQLTRTFSLRVESGTSSAFGLFFRRSFD